jgi:hypothetical protein
MEGKQNGETGLVLGKHFGNALRGKVFFYLRIGKKG